jgi:hypothetical protein
MGLNASRSSTAEALAQLHAGRWPALYRVESDGRNQIVHPRLALAPLLARDDTQWTQLARDLLAKSPPPMPARNLTMAKCPASTAMAALGIGRVPYAKLIYDGHLVPDSRNCVSTGAVNALLWAIAPIDFGTVVRDTWVRLRSGHHRASLSSVASAIKAGRKSSEQADAEAEAASLGLASIISSNSPQNSQGFTLATAAVELRTNTESIRAAIRVGLLTARKGSRESAVQWVIDPSSLDVFHRNFIFASALAANYGAARTTLSSRLRSAGLDAISGPGIDGGVTYVFRRAELAELDLIGILNQPYRSPAGRKKQAESVRLAETLSRRAAAAMLGLNGRELRKAIADGWISPISTSPTHWGFEPNRITELQGRLRDCYRDLSDAAKPTGQSVPEFRRTWIDTGFAAVRRFGTRLLIEATDLDRIVAIWNEAATSTAIGRGLSRGRWLCPNLQKMGMLQPVIILGSGNRRVRLYSRTAVELKRYDLT